MTSSIAALQIVAEKVATVLDGSTAIAAMTGHGAPQCQRMGSHVDETLPQIAFQVSNCRPRGGLLGSFRLDVDLIVIADHMPAASELLAVVSDALSVNAFDAAGLDAIPAIEVPVSADPLDPEDVPFPDACGVATTLALDVFIPTDE